MAGRLGAEAKLARELGVTVRELYGWTPRTFTRHTYNDAGQLTDSVSWTETRFTPAELAVLLASQRENIGPHGVPMDQAMDPANKGRFIAEATVDFAAQAVSAARKAFERDYAHQDLSSLMWSARLPEPEVTAEQTTE